MHGTGNSSTRTLNINRECESISAKNIDITDSPDSANTILICAQFNIGTIKH